jgi:uncharacterized protein (TIGR02246 family)
MRTFIPLLLALGFVFSNSPARAADPEEDIRDLLKDQTAAWNRGDLESFIKSYAEDCTFVGQKITKGRKGVLARYKTQYPTAAAMGKLTFHNLEVREIGEHVALVTGEWHLERPVSVGGEKGGLFSLVMKDIDDEWRIMLDHTS